MLASRRLIVAALAGGAAVVYGGGGNQRWVAAAAAAGAVDPVEAAKKAAAQQAVNDYVRDGMAIGIGSGSTIVYAIEYLAELERNKKLKGVVCVPTSFQSKELALALGLRVVELSQYPELEVALDGADEVDPQLNCIKGGGGCQTQEKIVASCAKKFVVIADYRKQGRALGQGWRKGVPLEVIPMAIGPVMRRLTKMNGKPVLRMGGAAKAGPAVTDNGNLLVDVDFGEIANPAQLDEQLRAIPGIVETGLFVDMAEKAYFGNADGTVAVWTKKQSK